MTAGPATRIAAAALLGALAPALPGAAGVALDGSLRDTTADLINPSEGRYLITRSHGHQQGENLFYSFGEFDLPEPGDLASFRNLFMDDQGNVSSGVGVNEPGRILARITQGRASLLGGTVETGPLYRNPLDVFLLNPYGFLIGKDANIDVNGSLYLGAADALLFGDDELSTGVADAGALLQVDPPEAFGFAPTAFRFSAAHPAFAGETDAAIRFEPGESSRRFAVEAPAGETVGFVGANVEIADFVRITARSARVDLVAVASPRDVPLDAADLAPGSFSGPASDSALGEVRMVNAEVDLNGVAPGDPSGSIVIRGERFVMQGASQRAEHRAAGSDPAPAIDVEVAGSLELSEGLLQVRNLGDGDGRGISLRAADVLLGAGASVDTSNRSDAGAGGAIQIAATSSFEARAGGQVVSRTEGGGTGGAIRVEGPSVTLREGARIESASEGPGSGGGIEVVAGLLRVDSTNTAGETSRVAAVAAASGDGGHLDVRPREGSGLAVQLENGGQIFTRTRGAGRAGDLTVGEAERVRAAGEIAIGSAVFPSGITARTLGNATGNAGRLEIRAREVRVEDGAQISAATGSFGDGGTLAIHAEHVSVSGRRSLVSAQSTLLGGPEAIEDHADLGRAGGFEIRTDVLEASGGGQITVTNNGVKRSAGDSAPVGRITARRVSISGSGSGLFAQSLTPATIENGRDGGDLVVTATEDVRVSGGGRISAASIGTGNAGSIRIDAQRRLVLIDSRVTTEALGAAGGRIVANAGERIELQRSSITTSVQGQTDASNAGDIHVGSSPDPAETVEPPAFVVLDGSRISANAFEGDGGNIRLVARSLLRSPDSAITATSQRGVSGEIEIAAPESNLISELAALPAEFFDVSSLLTSACAARTASEGSFVVRTRGALVASPPERLAWSESALPTVAAGGAGVEECALWEEAP